MLPFLKMCVCLRVSTTVYNLIRIRFETNNWIHLRFFSKCQRESASSQEFLDATILHGLFLFLLGGRRLFLGTFHRKGLGVGVVAPIQTHIPYAVFQFERISSKLVDHVLVFLVLGNYLILADNTVARNGASPPVSGSSFECVRGSHGQSAAGRVDGRLEACRSVAGLELLVGFAAYQFCNGVGGCLSVAVVECIVVRVPVGRRVIVFVVWY
mmetsp:Transcript_15845/g.32760  ORF Transcript_15845/g.32760 Transcript_15845/m.32760 type:complete len:212 (+) Transcript_15845:335-970(+)